MSHVEIIGQGQGGDKKSNHLYKFVSGIQFIGRNHYGQKTNKEVQEV